MQLKDSRLDSVLTSRGSASIDRLVLRYEIFLGARYAVVISPTIDHRQLCTPVTMLRRRVGCLPFEGRSPPGVAARRLALGETPNQVEQKHHLDGRYEQGRNGDGRIRPLGRRRDKVSAAKGVIPPWHTQDAQIVRGKVDRISSEECKPEMDPAQDVIQHAAGNQELPVIERPIH